MKENLISQSVSSQPLIPKLSRLCQHIQQVLLFSVLLLMFIRTYCFGARAGDFFVYDFTDFIVGLNWSFRFYF